MIPSINWLLYDNRFKLPDNVYTQKCLDVLAATADCHRGLNATAIYNNVTGYTNSHNWMKMSVGTVEGATAPSVVIVYSLLKHRKKLGYAPEKQWSITVGFDQALVASNPSKDPNDPKNLFVQLAAAINSAVLADIKASNGRFNPAVTSLLWIDDVEVKEKPYSAPPKYIVESEVNLMARPIGQLVWTAERNRAIRSDWPTWSVSMLPLPRDANDVEMLVYGRTGMPVFVTEIIKAN